MAILLLRIPGLTSAGETIISLIGSLSTAFGLVLVAAINFWSANRTIVAAEKAVKEATAARERVAAIEKAQILTAQATSSLVKLVETPNDEQIAAAAREAAAAIDSHLHG